MYDRSSGEIERAAHDGMRNAKSQDSAAPDPMTERAVDDRTPEDREQNHGAELHAFGEGSANQRGSDDEKHSLEQHVRQARNGSGHRLDHALGGFVPRALDALHEQVVAVPKVGIAAAE